MEKDKENKIILKESSSLATIPFQSFSAREIDFFYAVCYKLQNQGTNKAVIYYDEFRYLTGYQRRGNDALLAQIKEVSFKFSRLSIIENYSSGFKIIVPFIDFEADSKKQCFTVSAHPDFVSALNDLDGTPGRRYTLANVLAITRLKSTYSKQCLRMLFLYRNTGYWFPSIDELRYQLDIPQSYRISDITKRVIEPITKEFNALGIFEKFEVTTKTEKEKGRGRNPVTGYIFAFKFSDDTFGKRMALPVDEEHLIVCPLCRKPLYKIKRKDGDGFFYGHKDGWKKDAPCHYTTSNLDNVENAVTKMEDTSGYVTSGELEKYYRYLREQSVLEMNERREDIRLNDNYLWELFREREKIRAEAISAVTTFTITDEGRKKKAELQEKSKWASKMLSDELKAKGYPEDYMDLRYKCKVCKDTGQRDDGKNCSCRKERVEEAMVWLKKK